MKLESILQLCKRSMSYGVVRENQWLDIYVLT